MDAASQMLGTLLSGFLEALPQITQGAVVLVTTLAKGIVENLPALVKAAVEMVAILSKGIAESLPELDLPPNPCTSPRVS